MNTKISSGLLCALFAAAALAGSATVQAKAADAGAGTSAQPPNTKKAAKKKSSKDEPAQKSMKATFMQGSEESAGQRNARLKRECKGAVDAGACTGYTR